jgi:hypothetical protein
MKAFTFATVVVVLSFLASAVPAEAQCYDSPVYYTSYYGSPAYSTYYGGPYYAGYGYSGYYPAYSSYYTPYYTSYYPSYGWSGISTPWFSVGW